MSETIDKGVGLTDRQLELIGHLSTVDPTLLAEGLELVEQEKKANFREAIKNHWRAVLWSALLSMALVMDSFDGSLLGSLYGLPAFKERFGNIMTSKGPAIDPNWQTGIQFCGLPGSFLGLYLCGWGQERYGSRKTYLAGMCAVTVVIFLYVFMQNLPMLLVAQALAAGCWSLFNTLSAAYAAEICPVQLRGYATSFISMCWGMGSFIASGVLRGTLNISGDWSWRLPFVLQWIWPVILISGVFWAPESPWWLVRKGRIEDAKQTLIRTASKGYWDSRNIDAYIAVIQHTDDLERADAASGSWREMFKGSNRRRTEVEMGCWAIQVWSGTAMTAYAVQFLQSAGMNTVQSFNFNIIITAMNLVGVPVDFVLMRYFGRRPLIIFGLISLAAALTIIGAFGCVPATMATLTGIGACCAFINLAYHASIGPLTYTVAAEVPASRLRAKSLAWGRTFYTINYNATAQLTPRMVALGGWGWGSKAAFFWLGGNILITIWAFFRLPETGGLSFADLDILFANKVSARKFKSTKIVNEVATEQKVEGLDAKEEVEHVEAPRAVLT